jgi:hypothetical protein
MTILLPGDYILELKTSRPMDETTLTSVLEGAGFNRLVFDSPIASAKTPAEKVSSSPLAAANRPPSISGCDPSFLLEDEYYAPPQFSEALQPPQDPAPQAQVAPPQVAQVASPQVAQVAPPQVAQVASPQVAQVAPPQVVVRIVGRLSTPARLSDLPGLTWKSHKLRVSPNASLNLTTTPFKVLNGQAYDLKFLSADKRHPTRKHVVAAFIAMGFKPFILAAIKKNARIPGRPNVSMTEWIAVARWIKPSDTILDDKPFHFEDLREVLS